MKNTNKCIKTIALFLIVIQCVLITPNISFNVKAQVFPANINLEANLSAPITNINTDDPLEISFDNTGILSYSYSAIGLQATEISSSENEIVYEISTEDSQGKFSFTANYADDVTVTKNVYTYLEDSKLSTSTVSQEQAWYEWIYDEYIRDIAEQSIDWDEIYDWWYNVSAELVIADAVDDSVDDNVTIQSGYTYVIGKLRWEQEAADGGGCNDLKKVRVELVDANNYEILATTITDETGEFCFEVSNSDWGASRDVFVCW